MKKTIAVILAVAMIAGIASCSKEPERKRKKDSGKSKKTEETDEDFEDFTEETIEDIVETTRKKKKDKTEETIPVPDGAYCLDGKTPEEIVEIGKYFADIKDNDTFIDIYKRVEVAPYNYDANELDKYDAYGIHFDWSYPLQDHAGIKEVYYEKNSYQYPNVQNIKLYEDSYVQITFYFANEEDCMAAEEAFYNYLCSLAELNTEKSTRREEKSGVIYSNLVFKSYPVKDSRVFSPDCSSVKIDRDTYEEYCEPTYTIYMQNTTVIGCYLTVQIPIGGHIYQGGK